MALTCEREPCRPHDQHLGWGRKRGKSLWKCLRPHFWVWSPPLFPLLLSHPSLAQNREVGQKELSFPTQSPICSLSQEEKTWGGQSSHPDLRRRHTWNRQKGPYAWQTVLTWLVLSEICFSISCTICLNVGLFRGSASQQVIIISYLQNKGRVPLLLNGLHLSSDVCHTIISKTIPGVGNWTYWMASALNTLKCCWN